MAPKTLPPRALIHQLLRYDAATGDLIWLPRPIEMFTGKRWHTMWMTKFCGRVAGWVKPQADPRRKGYLHINYGGRHYKVHRLVWLHVYGEPVPDIIDHIDQNVLNNRIENLRAATKARNCANGKTRAHNRLGIKGVHETPDGTFVAKAGNFHLGTFATIEEAAAAYRRGAREMYGEFAWDGHRQK